jgi:hypothetical protein
MGKIEDQIAELKKATEDKIKQLQARKEAAEARKLQAMTKGRRSADTRRKILAGAWVLETMKAEELKTKLDGFLKRDDERELFGLSPLPKRAISTKAPTP